MRSPRIDTLVSRVVSTALGLMKKERDQFFPEEGRENRKRIFAKAPLRGRRAQRLVAIYAVSLQAAHPR